MRRNEKFEVIRTLFFLPFFLEDGFGVLWENQKAFFIFCFLSGGEGPGRFTTDGACNLWSTSLMTNPPGELKM